MNYTYTRRPTYLGMMRRPDVTDETMRGSGNATIASVLSYQLLGQSRGCASRSPHLVPSSWILLLGTMPLSVVADGVWSRWPGWCQNPCQCAIAGVQLHWPYVSV